MLVKLTPEQIAANWEVIKDALNIVMSPLDSGRPDRNPTLLRSLLTDCMQGWAICREEGGNKVTILGFVFTTFTANEDLAIKNLLIYGVCGYGEFPKNVLKKSLITLARYAKGLGCASVIGHTNNEAIIRLANRLGAKTDMRFISLPVG